MYSAYSNMESLAVGIGISFIVGAIIIVVNLILLIVFNVTVSTKLKRVEQQLAMLNRANISNASQSNLNYSAYGMNNAGAAMKPNPNMVQAPNPNMVQNPNPNMVQNPGNVAGQNQNNFYRTPEL